MNEYWFYAKGANVLGPVQTGQLKSLAASGQLLPSDMVIRAGEKTWVPASSLPWLFASATTPAPAGAAQPAAGQPSARVGLLPALGFLLGLLLIGGLLTTTVLFFMEMNTLQAELEKVQPSAQSEPKKSTGAAEAAVKKLVKSPEPADAAIKKRLSAAEAEIERLQQKIKEDADTIGDLKEQLEKKSSQKAKKNPPTIVQDKVNLYDKIDQHALNAPPEAEASVSTLAKYLTAPARNDDEKVRAIFRWVADRISYDAPALFNNTRPDQRAPAVLQSRKGVCEGYANLFKELCQQAGIESVKIIGFGKGVNGTLSPATRQNHAWNAVKLNGEWRLIEVTWAAGGLSDKQFKKYFNDFYYLTQPDLFIMDHWPADHRWQLLDPPVTEDTFRTVYAADMLKIQNLLRVGILKKETLLQEVKERKDLEWVKSYQIRGQVTVHAAPTQRELQAGTKMYVKLETPTYDKVAIIVNGNFTELTRQPGNIFEGAALLDAGKATVGLRPAGEFRYQIMLEYVVR